jgi:uncharacterized membrane protein YphA (DoxX/SURF4 family)
MLHDPNVRNTFIPLILRLTLAAIFIYHGVGKISGPQNDFGVAWATHMWQKQATVPAAPMAELGKGLKRLQEEEANLKKQGEALAGTEKEENVKKLEENAAKQTDFRMTEERIKAAYSAATPLPAALSDQWVQLAVAWGELLCGIAMLLGLFTRVAALGLVVIMVGAIYMVTGAQGFSNPAGGGYEYNLAILAICVVLLIKGSGALSVDGWLASRRRSAQQQRQPVAV